MRGGKGEGGGGGGGGGRERDIQVQKNNTPDISKFLNLLNSSKLPIFLESISIQ